MIKHEVQLGAHEGPQSNLMEYLLSSQLNTERTVIEEACYQSSNGNALETKDREMVSLKLLFIRL